MSDMLEQAIIDAEALKEAATKNAETLILEKYSDQLKNAVESLLEQEEPGLAAAPEGMLPEEPAMGGLGAEEAEISSVMEHIPLAATAKDDDQVVIPLDKLLEEINTLKESMRFGGDDQMDEVLDEDLFLEEELEEDFDNALYEDELEEELLETELYEEDYEISEDIDSLSGASAWSHGRPETHLGEALTVDIGEHSVKRGWTGLPEAHFKLAEEELLALEQDSKVREAEEAKRKAVRELNGINETLTKQNTKLTKTLNKSGKYITRLRDAVLVLEEKLDRTSINNARLLYQNKALTSDSLNERQKQALVEAVSNAETIEEAKVIFETLQNTVGSTSRKSQPNSLSEAVQKTSSVILSARKENSSRQNNNPTLERWKFLAGIDK